MSLLRSILLEQAGFLHAFPTRDVSDEELRAALAAARIVQLRQVHGARAVDAGEAGDADGQEADAIVAAGGGFDPPAGRFAVGVRVADCVPILAADPETGGVAAIHAGWRGVVRGVVPASIERLAGASRARGGRCGPGSLVVAIGPCIGACCFEVGADVALQIGFVVRAEGEKSYVDLRAAVRAQLRAFGVTADRIEDVPGCSKHEPARFHSFRRDGKESGRMLAAIAPRPPAGVLAGPRSVRKE